MVSTDIFLVPTLLYTHSLHILMGCPNSRLPCCAKQLVFQLQQRVIGKVVVYMLAVSNLGLKPSTTILGFQFVPAAMQCCCFKAGNW